MTWSGLDDLAAAIRRSTRGMVVLTGAGVSVASGIPSFRGNSGLWTRWDPEEYATIQAFDRDPARVWKFLRELGETLEEAEPNEAHRAIAAMSDGGFVDAVVTQNVDGLHQRAGSERVIELHGSHRTLSCRRCDATFPVDEVAAFAEDEVPTCGRCGGVLKPDVVLFGEPMPQQALRQAEHAVRHCGVLLVVGTSVEVHPASRLPEIAARAGAAIWEVNPQPAVAGANAIVGRAESVLPVLAATLERRVSGLSGRLRSWFGGRSSSG